MTRVAGLAGLTELWLWDDAVARNQLSISLLSQSTPFLSPWVIMHVGSSLWPHELKGDRYGTPSSAETCISIGVVRWWTRSQLELVTGRLIGAWNLVPERGFSTSPTLARYNNQLCLVLIRPDECDIGKLIVLPSQNPLLASQQRELDKRAQVCLHHLHRSLPRHLAKVLGQVLLLPQVQ